MRERPLTVLAGNKLALVTDAVVAALVRPLRVLAAHVAAPAVIAWLDSLHTHILSSGPRGDFVTRRDEQRFLVRNACTKFVLDTDFVTRPFFKLLWIGRGGFGLVWRGVEHQFYRDMDGSMGKSWTHYEFSPNRCTLHDD